MYHRNGTVIQNNLIVWKCIQLIGLIYSRWSFQILWYIVGTSNYNCRNIKINKLRCGIPISDENTVSILLYADDIVLITDSSDGLQNMLNTLHSWSKTCVLKVNNDKSKIMHFRKSSRERTHLEFPYGDTTLDIVHMYRYLGLNLYEHIDFSESVKCLTTASSRALGSVTNKYYSTNGLHNTTYTKLYDAMVSPVMDYGCETSAGKKRDSCDTVKHRAMRTFLGVGKCTPQPAARWHAVHVTHGCISEIEWDNNS